MLSLVTSKFADKIFISGNTMTKFIPLPSNQRVAVYPRLTLVCSQNTFACKKRDKNSICNDVRLTCLAIKLKL